MPVILVFRHLKSADAIGGRASLMLFRTAADAMGIASANTVLRTLFDG